MSNESGRLFVVATPIGNLGDLSDRAREVLATVHRIAAEDTRRSGQLLGRLGIRGRMISLHEHNESERVERILSCLAAGESIALVSDAGTPLISDPGYRLVRATREAGFEVLAVPGPSSVIAALSVAGLPTDRFFFEGFLPARTAARRRRLERLAGQPHTLVFLEAGRRVPAALDDLAEILGAGRESAVCRELTKRFETTRSGSLAQLAEWIRGDADRMRGEFVILVGPGVEDRAPAAATVPDTATLLQMLRGEGLGAKAAARVTARITGESANALYDRAVQEG
ncbi:16S rRNA (cytidine(1402)-2'-O)-methyltransferase [Spiribacter onubensis]|uniref:Ribosomal RNA small subunit methyltransferase I n=1 Tax=Spiribacter onubensis TaxID=3122420 RepID=A0ABV3S714_9GAMM